MKGYNMNRKNTLKWMKSRLRRLLCEKTPTERQVNRINQLKNNIAKIERT